MWEALLEQFGGSEGAIALLTFSPPIADQSNVNPDLLSTSTMGDRY
ncbi:MAG: hypothetical protein AB1589_07280 [Cyanobacteriota bacterium]